MSWFYESGGNELKQYTNTGIISIVKTDRKQITPEQATDGLGLPMTLFSEKYHKLIRHINTNAWELNKMLKEMSLFCFPRWTIDFSFASKSQSMPFSVYSTTRLPGYECDQKLKSTSTVWIQCFRVLNQNSTMEMSMSGHERVTDFRYVLLLEKLLQAECLCPPQIHMWKPPQSEGVRRWDLWEVIRVRWNHESGASVMRLVDPKASFLCASKEGSCEHTRWWSPTSQEQRKWNWPCLCLDLGHASLQTVRSTFLLFEPLSLWYFGSLCRLRQ